MYPHFKSRDMFLTGSDSELHTAYKSLAEQPDSLDGCASRVDANALLAEETVFLDALHFQLVCSHPYRSLWVLLQHLHASFVLLDEARMHKLDIDKLAIRIEQPEHTIVHKLAVPGDTVLVHAPSMVALAAVVMASRDKRVLENGNGVIRAVGGIAAESGRDVGPSSDAAHVIASDNVVKETRRKVDVVIKALEYVATLHDDPGVVQGVEERRRLL